MRRLSSEQIERLREILSRPGTSVREAEKLSGHNRNTIMHYRRSFSLPNCPCGEVAGHKGWCKWRYDKSEARQAYQASRRVFAVASYDPLRVNNFRFQFTDYVPTMFRNPADDRCAIAACAFPVRKNRLCYQHLHFFDFSESMHTGQLSPEDMFDNEDPNSPVLYVATQRELEDLEKSVTVTYADERKRRADLQGRKSISKLLAYSGWRYAARAVDG